jgi:hypothetical protein
MTRHRPSRRAIRATAALLTAAALAVAAGGCGRGRAGGQVTAPQAGAATSQTAPGQGAPTTAAQPTGPTGPTTMLADPPATLPPASQTSRAARGARRIEILSPAEGATVGPTFDLRLDVRGFTLVEPNGNLDGTSGHLYVIVDGPPPPSNQLVRPGSGPVRLVGERMTIRNLAPGRHRILVIGANGYTVPFDPPVRATRTVTVRG